MPPTLKSFLIKDLEFGLRANLSNLSIFENQHARSLRLLCVNLTPAQLTSLITLCSSSPCPSSHPAELTCSVQHVNEDGSIVDNNQPISPQPFLNKEPPAENSSNSNNHYSSVHITRKNTTNQTSSLVTILNAQIAE